MVVFDNAQLIARVHSSEIVATNVSTCRRFAFAEISWNASIKNWFSVHYIGVQK